MGTEVAATDFCSLHTVVECKTDELELRIMYGFTKYLNKSLQTMP